MRKVFRGLLTHAFGDSGQITPIIHTNTPAAFRLAALERFLRRIV